MSHACLFPVRFVIGDGEEFVCRDCGKVFVWVRDRWMYELPESHPAPSAGL